MVGLVEMMPALHALCGGRDDARPSAGGLERGLRLGHLYLLEAFGDEDRDSLT
jgi:hypothetical protein